MFVGLNQVSEAWSLYRKMEIYFHVEQSPEAALKRGARIGRRMKSAL